MSASHDSSQNSRPRTNGGKQRVQPGSPKRISRSAGGRSRTRPPGSIKKEILKAAGYAVLGLIVGVAGSWLYLHFFIEPVYQKYMEMDPNQVRVLRLDQTVVANKPVSIIGYDFRRTRWGMTREDVRQAESLTIEHEDPKTLGYRTVLGQKKVFLFYVFSNDRLVRARYVLSETRTNKNDYIDDFKDFKKMLSDRYGPPVQDRTIWLDGYYRNDPDNWGEAIGTGSLKYISTWQSPSTSIICILKGWNRHVECLIEFTSKPQKQPTNKRGTPVTAIP